MSYCISISWYVYLQVKLRLYFLHIVDGWRSIFSHIIYRMSEWFHVNSSSDQISLTIHLIYLLPSVLSFLIGKGPCMWMDKLTLFSFVFQCCQLWNELWKDKKYQNWNMQNLATLSLKQTLHLLGILCPNCLKYSNKTYMYVT